MLLAGGGTCAAFAVLGESSSPSSHQTPRRRSIWTTHSSRHQLHCEASSAPHSVQKSPVAARSSQALPTEGLDFAVFQRQPGPLVDAEGAMVASHMKCLRDLLDAISASVAPQSSLEASMTNVILLGEVHDDRVAHQFQLLVLRHCVAVCKATGRRLVLSLEMFENDVQQVLDEYVLQKAIREQDFLQDARPWANYAQDYRPLVELCREHSVQVVAANAPRRYVSLTARAGSRALKELVEHVPGNSPLPPLPLPSASAAYQQKFMELMASQIAPAQAADGSGECPYIGFKARDVQEARPEMIEAQLLWDHTMAQSIGHSLKAMSPACSFNSKNSLEPPLVVHVCGAFHCAHGLGIPEVLPQYCADSSTLSPPGAAQGHSPTLWLPMDEVLPQVQTENGNDSRTHDLGPKQSPPGVISVVCWPGAVGATVAGVRGGQQFPSLGIMGDWVVVTQESS